MNISARINDTRIRNLNDKGPLKGRYVLYWMQQSQREHYNHALEYAVQRANGLGQPLVVVFGLTADYPEANARHYRFMIEGLADTRKALAERGIKMVVRTGDPASVALDLAAGASVLVCDMGYLRHQRAWRKRVSKEAGCETVQVESDAVVPVETASDKAEIGARTLRPRIRRQLESHMVGLRRTPLGKGSVGMKLDGIDPSDVEATLELLGVDDSVAPAGIFRGGTSAAKREFGGFMEKYLPGYSANRNRPETDNVSHMAMYLHFGQISPLYLALKVAGTKSGRAEDRDSYLEELIVRRELANNFVYYTRDYDRFSCLPGWAARTLKEHARDRRPYRYGRRRLEGAGTHDPYWNASMLEMKHTGYMHNYMRMYWGKKILEWSGDPGEGFRTALYLNNKYFIDGRDPSSYAGVAWVFGVHDRAWPQREIFGKVRYMSAGGLERKADPAAYVAKVERLVRG